jgi:CRP/FNR family cyclic AMP-dependent transcriptional regulator
MVLLGTTVAELHSPIEARKHLAEHPFVDGMDPQHLRMMEDLVQQVHFDADHCVFREGNPADRLYLLLRGSVALAVDNLDYGPVPFQTLGGGEVLGWSWLVAPYCWRFNALAIEETEALAFDVDRLTALCEKNPAFGYDFMKRMAAIMEQRLTAAKEHLQDTYASG